jgi:ketosteroid isomerase-like protein
MSAETEVQTVFIAAKNAFNEQDTDTLMQYVDQYATVYSVSRQVEYSGYAGVQQYFETEFSYGNKPNFDPTGIPIPTFNETNTTALISGSATWTSRHSPGGYPLQYVFTFVNRGDGWLILTMWGS